MSANENITNLLLNNIKTLNIPTKNDAIEKKIIGNLYNDLYISYKKVKKMTKEKKIKINTIMPTNKNDIPKSYLFDSHFCIKGFKEIVYQETTRVLVYNCVLRNIAVTININDLSGRDDINKYTVIHVLSMIDLLMGYANISKTKSLKIFLYLTDKKKLLPDSNVCVLNSENVNSAVTYSCNVNGEILIFRKEEWLKCLIHELFHSLCLDFISLRGDEVVRTYLKSLFCVKSDYFLSESYNEWWATNLNCLLCSFMMLEKKNSKKECLEFYKLCITTEQMFTMIQITKVLRHMGLTYNMLIDKNIDCYIKENLYKEKTNVFCYYIIKGILLFNNGLSMTFFKENNTSLLNFDKTPQTLEHFLNYIGKYYNTDDIKETFDKYDVFYNSLLKHDDKASATIMEKLKNTMQMTLTSIN